MKEILLEGVYLKGCNQNLLPYFDENSTIKGLDFAEIITRCKIEHVFFIC